MLSPEAATPPGRRWNPWEIGPIHGVDTAGIGLLRVRVWRFRRPRIPGAGNCLTPWCVSQPTPHEHGWSRSDDPARARAQHPGHLAYIEASKLRAGLEQEADPRKLIRDYLVQRVEHGAVRSRADVVSALESVGLEVPRQGKNYVTARDLDSGKRWRLKGELYEHDFRPERLDLPPPAPDEDRPAADRGDGRARARAAWEKLERRRERRAAIRRRRPRGCARCC